MPPTKTNPVEEVVKALTQKRKEPWRDVEKLKAAEDKVEVNKVRDMRLFGNHVNAHS